jgi:uncharacterized membrane protein (DUF485 family)
LESQTPHPIEIPDEAHARLAHAVMRKQATLSISISLVFLIILFGLPLFNLWFPELASRPVFGFTLSWLILGVLFYPVTWVLSWYYIRESDRIEAACGDWRSVLGEEAGEPLEPAGLGEVKPAFVETDITATDTTHLEASDTTPPKDPSEGHVN